MFYLSSPQKQPMSVKAKFELQKCRSLPDVPSRRDSKGPLSSRARYSIYHLWVEYIEGSRADGGGQL